MNCINHENRKAVARQLCMMCYRRAHRSGTLPKQSNIRSYTYKKRAITNNIECRNSRCINKTTTTGYNNSGLCQSCYQKLVIVYAGEIKQKTVTMCSNHPDRKSSSRGMCWQCYEAFREENNK